MEGPGRHSPLTHKYVGLLGNWSEAPAFQYSLLARLFLPPSPSFSSCEIVPRLLPGNTLLLLPPSLTMKGRPHRPLSPGVLATPCIQAFAHAAPSPWTTCPPSLHQLNSTLPVPLSSDITSSRKPSLIYHPPGSSVSLYQLHGSLCLCCHDQFQYLLPLNHEIWEGPHVPLPPPHQVDREWPMSKGLNE